MSDRCPILLNLTLTPGAVFSPDGPRRSVTIQCKLERGHSEGHKFPVPKAAA